MPVSLARTPMTISAPMIAASAKYTDPMTAVSSDAPPIQKAISATKGTAAP